MVDHGGTVALPASAAPDPASGFTGCVERPTIRLQARPRFRQWWASLLYRL